MSEISLNYTLTKYDFIEAGQIYKKSNRSFWLNGLLVIVLFYDSTIELWRISDPYFLVFEYAKNNMRIQTTGDHIVNFFFFLLCCFLIFGQNFPKYNPLSRWNISRKYNRDFIKQEAKTIEINETGITRKSANYCEFRKWSGYSKFIESKNMFLLLGKWENNIIPKRIFTTEEQLQLFRTMLDDKINK